jgi:hypothetical protein
MQKPLSVGSDIESYCGRCKLDLNHVVVAMVDNMPRRVRCLTCGNEHNYRLPKSKTVKTSRSRSSSSKSSSAARKTSAAGKWHAVIATWSDESAKRYNIFETFEVNDFVSHTKFGKGVVTDVPAPDKIIALFESGEKMLIHGKKR